MTAAAGAAERRRTVPAAGGWRGRLIVLYAGLLGANLLAWAWALLAFRAQPLLLGTALLAYGFGLRHAVDADHIAAIDNVTRKLMQQGRRPLAVGLYFSLGHSTIVLLASIAAAVTAAAFRDHIDALHGLGAVVGTVISAAFLLLIAAANAVVLVGVWRSLRALRRGTAPAEADLDGLLLGGGLLARVLRPLFRLVGHSWHVYPLGVLFGLGFDTATEIGVLGLSAAGASHGLSLWSILVFPALFTAGMSLVDTTDGIVMTGAYGWAMAEPVRKLYYNLTITGASVVVALAVGGIEALGLIGDRLGLSGQFWTAIGWLGDHFGELGFAIVGVMLLSWLVSVAIWRARSYARAGGG